MLVGVWLGLVEPNRFRCEGKLLVRFGQREMTTPEEAIRGTSVGPVHTSEIVSNELQLLASPSVYGGVVERLGIDEILQPYDPDELYDHQDRPYHVRLMHDLQRWWFRVAAESGGEAGVPLERKARRFLERTLSIQPIPGTGVLSISMEHHDPRVAQKIVDAFLAEALERHREVYSASATLPLVTERLEAVRAEHTEAQEAMTSFRIENGIYEPESQRQELLTELNAIESAIQNDERELSRAAAEEEYYRSLLKGEPEERTFVSQQQKQLNPEFTWIQEQLRELKRMKLALQLEDQTTRAEQKRQRLQLIDSEIDALRTAAEQTPRFIESGNTQTHERNPRYVRLQQLIEEADALQAGLSTAVSQRRTRADQLRDSLHSLEKSLVRYRDLEERLEAARTQLERFERANEELSLLMLLDEGKLSNLRVLQDATYSTEKVGPDRVKRVLMGGFLGVAGALLIALLRQILGRRLTLPSEAAGSLGVPVLCVIPRSRGWAAVRKRDHEGGGST